MKLDLQTDLLRAVAVNLIDAGDTAIVKRGRVELKIAGSGAAAVVGAILGMARDGISRDDLLARFGAPERETVGALVDHLVARRILIPPGVAAHDDAAADSQLEIFYWHFGTGIADARKRMNAARLAILGVNHVSRELASGLRASGADRFEVLDVPLLRNVEIAADAPNEWGGAPVRHLDGEPDPETIDCIIATSDGGGIEQLRVWNEYAVLHSLRFYPIVLQDLVGYIGPLYVPGQTACYECLRLRQNAHLVDYANRRIVESAFIHSQSVSGFHPAMASILGSIAAIELTKAFGLAPALTRAGTLIEVNLIGSEMTSRRVLRLPRCPVCSRLNRAPSPSLPAARLAPAGERQER